MPVARFTLTAVLLGCFVSCTYVAGAPPEGNPTDGPKRRTAKAPSGRTISPTSSASTRATKSVAAASRAQAALDLGADQGRYTFLIFHKDDGPETEAMLRTVEEALAERADEAAMARVVADEPAEQAVIERFKVGRAPMPLTLAVAPNGAVTGIYPRKLSAADLEKAFVTPTMMRCMKSLQSGKLVLVCVHASRKGQTTAAAADFVADPNFQDRSAIEHVLATDAREARLMEQMKIDPQQHEGTLTVVLAPPGMMIGKFDSQATSDDIAAAVHKAGKCCDDPNCKHNREEQDQSASGGETRSAVPEAKGNTAKRTTTSPR
jgi:hypothetical protein